jgi:hypothetical protein
MVSEGCGDVSGLGQAQDGDREVAQAGHDAGAVAGEDLGQVLAERHAADPRESVLDGSVTAQRVGELGRTGLGRAQRGDRIDRLGGPSRAVQAPPATDDLDRLRGVRKPNPAVTAVSVQPVKTSVTVRV